MYDIDYNASDYVHVPNKSYRNMGNYYGRSIFEVIVNKRKSQAIFPIKHNREGNEVYIQFAVPNKPLAFDESLVNALSDGNKGFNLVNVSNELTTTATIAASATTITNVALYSEDTVKITLSGAPAAGTRLTYGVNGDGWNAINGTKSPTAKSGRMAGARGNLRDSATYYNPIGDYFNQYNWTVIFEIIL